MKKLKLLCLCVGVVSINQAYAETNLFAPKGNTVSKEDLNNIVNDKLDEQKNILESNFRNEINNISESQAAQLKIIMERLETMQNENNKIKNEQINLNNNTNRFSGTSGDQSYTLGEMNDELSVLILSDPETSILTDQDTERLNKEFGESSLKFIGVVGDKKMYKNSNDEYIIKNLDFEYVEVFEDELEDQ